jgi:hypothetical protein
MTTHRPTSRISKTILIVEPHRICGAVIAAALIGAAATAGTAAYSANQQKKASAANQKAMGSVPDVKLPEYPDFVPHDFNQLQDNAVNSDRAFYARSDADFKRRHRGLRDAERLFEAQVLKDQKGNSELMPALQAELMKGGMAESLAAFGGDTGTLAPGSAGEARVATHMGQGIMDFQQRNRDNRERSLALAEQLFPRREIGLSGRDHAAIIMNNTSGVNNHAQAAYGAGVQAEFTRHGQDMGRANATITSNNAQAQADAQMAAAIAQGIGKVADSGATAYGKYQERKAAAAGAAPAPASNVPTASAATAKPIAANYKPAYTGSVASAAGR